MSKFAALADLEEGELETAAEEQQQETKSQVLEASSTPCGSEGWQASNVSAKKKTKKKQLQKAINSGQKVDRAVYRAVYGDAAKPALVVTQKGPIRVPDIQALVLWVLADRKEGKNPGWAFVKNLPLIRQVIVVFVPGISSTIFRQRQELFPNLAKLGAPLPVLAKDALVRPGYSVAAFLTVPLAKEKRQYLRQMEAGMEPAKHANSATTPASSPAARPFPPGHYVLRPEMMEKMGYPLPVSNDSGRLVPPEGFVMTQSRPRTLPTGTEAAGVPQDILRAIDCEMCETDAGVYELTRIAMLNEQGEVVYDELVLPRNSIRDYHTDKSGITEELLRGVTTRLEDVQRRFLELVPAETILVGHALENDLKALKAVHMRCIDTGALFPHPRGLPFRSALRRLAEKFLKRQIQQGSHDPVVDARTALQLAQLKMKHGPAFGLSQQQATGDPLLEVLMRSNKPCTLIDKPDSLNRYLTGTADGVSCSCDEDVTEKLCREARRERPPDASPRFVWAQLRELAEFYERRAEASRRAAALERAEQQQQQEASEAAGPSQKPDDQPTGAGAPVADVRRGEIRQPGNAPSSEEPQTHGAKRAADEAAVATAGRHPNKRQHVAGAADVATAPRLPEASETDAAEGLVLGITGADAVAAATPADSGASAQAEEGERAENQEERLLRQADANVGRVHAAAPEDTLLIVASCNGDTASTRLAHEQKVRRMAGLQQPPWTQEDEHHYCKHLVESSIQGLCFATLTGS